MSFAVQRTLPDVVSKRVLQGKIMSSRTTIRHRRLRRRAAARVVLLMLPAIFWSAVFVALAGAQPVERMLACIPDTAQILVAMACPLLASALSLSANRRIGNHEVILATHRITLAAGLSLFVLALLATLAML